MGAGLLEILLEILRDPATNVILAGAAGGLVKWIRLRESFNSGIVNVILGGVVAYYISPIALAVIRGSLGSMIDMTAAEQARLGGFIIGSMANSVVGAVTDLVTKYLEHKAKVFKDDE